MSDFESVFESDGESERLAGQRPEGKCKWAVYRLNEEAYSRLLTKRQRGEKINFKERGGDHQFTSANRKPTPTRVGDECGSGYFIVEHLFDGVAGDWSFVRIEPSVTQIGNEQVIPSNVVAAPSLSSRDHALELIVERLESLERRRESRPRSIRPHRTVRDARPSDSGPTQQIALVLELQRESREQERAMWQQLLESARTSRSSNGEAGAVDNPYALFAPLAASNPSLAEKLIDRAFPEEEKTSWMSDLLKHPQEAMQLVQVGVSLLASQTSSAATPSAASTPAGASPSQVAETEADAMSLIVFTLLDDVAKNRRVGRVADLIEEQCRKFPALAPTVAQILGSDNATIFREIQKSTGIDLTTYAHAADFIDELREELESTGSGDNADASSPGDPPSEVCTSADASASRNGDSGRPSAQAAVSSR